MTVFSKEKPKTQNTVFRLPVDTSAGPSGFLGSTFLKEQASVLYPAISNSSAQEVEDLLGAGLVGPLQARAEAVTRQKHTDVYNEVIEVTALDQMTPEEAIGQLETLREENPFLKTYVSPALIEALRQSDNPTARMAAQGKLNNVLIASEVINNKMSEAGEGWMSGIADFGDMLASELPIVSALNVSRRKELGDRFRLVMESNQDPAMVKAELQKIVDEAADMGFFTDANRFFIGDFLGLAMEEGEGGELGRQQLFSFADILLWGALGDAAKVISVSKGLKAEKEVTDALMRGIAADNPAGAIDPSLWGDTLSSAGRTVPRTPIESTAKQLAEIEIRARQQALEIRIASGSAIDDETFEVLTQTEIAASKKRAADAGNLRYIDAVVYPPDAMGNIRMVETYGTSKGRAFTSQVAAQKYADQILGRVTEPVKGQFVVSKEANVKTGIYSQGATPDEIIKDLNVWAPLDTDEFGSGFWAKYGSPFSQTDSTNNAILKQGEFARAKALDIVGYDIERSIKIVGPEGKAAVQKVYSELRDGVMASRTEAPTIAEFDDMFFKINSRRATEQELKLHEQVLVWNDVDWYFSADIHFKRAVERGVEIVVPMDGIEVAATQTSKQAQAGRLVWDADAAKYVDVDTLPDDRVIYRLVQPVDFGGKKHDLVASAAMKKRALKHTDVMGYNVGGARLYEPNQTNHMIKQKTSYKLADGTERQGVPRTIMAVKTEKEGAKAVSEINAVLGALHKIANPKAFLKAEDYLNVIKTKYKDAQLNDLIATNAGWNTDVHSVETLVKFADENNFDLRELVSRVGDGEPLVDGADMVGDITFKDVATSPGRLKLGDFRKDNVLMGYGGKKLPTVPPFEAIQRSVMSSVARQTEMAYETRSIMRLYRTALEKNLIPKENIALIRNMSLRQKANNMKILTSTEEGRKLELERKKITMRLEKQRMFDNAYHKAKDNLANALWDKGWKKTAGKIDALSADPVAGTRGIVFDAYLGLGAIDQFYVQASQIFNIMGMADKTLGIQAATLAPYFRRTLMNGHPGPTEQMAKLTSGITGIDPEHFVAMIETFKASGKGYVNASVADLGEDSGGKVFFDKVRKIGRIPYTEGETMSRITAHVAASLEYIKKNGPDANLKSQRAQRWVMHQSDLFTNGMSSTSRHPLEQIPGLQFMSYTMRMAEWYFAGIAGGKRVLSTKQKVRLFAFQAAMYGSAAAPGLSYFIDKYNANYGVELSESDFYQIRFGMIDNLIRYASGVETELGRRLAWGEGLFETIRDLQDKPIGEALLGPSATFGGTVMDAIVKMQNNLKYGGTSFLVEDTVDIFRSIKSVNMAHNAWMAFRWEIYRSRRGDVLLDDVSTGEAIATALGVPLHRVNELWRQSEIARKDQDWYRARARQVSTLYNDWYTERLNNGFGTAREKEIIAAIEVFNAIHGPYMSEINRYVDKKFITMNEEMTIKLMEKEAKQRAAEDGL